MVGFSGMEGVEMERSRRVQGALWEGRTVRFTEWLVLGRKRKTIMILRILFD